MIFDPTLRTLKIIAFRQPLARAGSHWSEGYIYGLRHGLVVLGWDPVTVEAIAANAEFCF